MGLANMYWDVLGNPDPDGGQASDEPLVTGRDVPFLTLPLYITCCQICRTLCTTVTPYVVHSGLTKRDSHCDNMSAMVFTRIAIALLPLRFAVMSVSHIHLCQLFLK